jgi:exopolyphosphatase / guanosine-5'-triphosphate,3'-diphosphate pyrophosphatase
MAKAAVDIGTNSMRLLVVDDAGAELERIQVVTGLGKGVFASGRLAEDAVERTLEVLEEFGRLMGEHGVTRARAVATAASRAAENREVFFDRAESAVGVRPDLIAGDEEARLSFLGATAGLDRPGPFVVVDIGGGSTEFVWASDGEVTGVSTDIGSVRVTERLLPDRPADFEQLVAVYHHADGQFRHVDVPVEPSTVIGVAGTWTSLAAIALDLPAYDRRRVHHSLIGRHALDRLVVRLAGLTVEETAEIPALDPRRASVILAGSLIAREVMRRLGVMEVLVSEHDLLDGIVAGLG